MSAKRGRRAVGARRPSGDAAGRVPVEEGILLAVVLLEPLLFLPTTRNPFIVKDLLLGAALLALAGARAVAVWRGRGACGIPGPVAALLGAAVIVPAALAWTSPEPLLSRDYVLRLLGFAALFLLAASREPSPGFFRRLCLAVLASTAVAAGYGVLQQLHLDPISWRDTFRPAGAPLSSVRVFSTFGHPNFFGPHLAMAICFTSAAALLAEDARLRRAAAAVTALAVFCLVLTANRGAWLGLAAAALFAVVALRRVVGSEPDGPASAGARLKPLLALSLAAVLLSVAVSPLVRARLAPGGLPRDPTVQSRLLIWSGALRMARDAPLAGLGPGTFGRLFPRFRDDRLLQFEEELTTVPHAHNEYLETLAETGVVGLAATLALWGAALAIGWRALRRARAGEERVAAAAVMAAVVSILVSSLFGVELRFVNTAFFFWLLLGLLAGRAAAAPQPAGARAVAAAALVGAVAFAVVTARAFAAETLLRDAEQSLAAGKDRDAARLGRAAQGWNRGDTAGLMLAAEALVRLKDYAGARAVYLEVEKINPGEPLIGYDLALTAYLGGAWDEGLDRIDAVRWRSPDHEPSRNLQYDLLLRKGLDFVERGAYSAGDGALLAASFVKPQDARAVLYYGNVRLLRGKYDSAVYFYRKALELDPASEPARENLARVEALLASQRRARSPGR